MRNQSVVSRLISGGTGGFVATIPMTAVMELYRRLSSHVGSDPFIPRQVAEGIASRAGFDEQVDALGEPGWVALTAISHFGFGSAAGTLYGLIEPTLSGCCKDRPQQNTKSEAHACSGRQIAQGAGFGLLVWATHYLLLFPALGIFRPHGHRPVRRNAGLVLSHLVWGISTALIFDAVKRNGREDLIRIH